MKLVVQKKNVHTWYLKYLDDSPHFLGSGAETSVPEPAHPSHYPIKGWIHLGSAAFSKKDPLRMDQGGSAQVFTLMIHDDVPWVDARPELGSVLE